MAQFESDLLEAAATAARRIFAWILLPNHYHLLVHTEQVTSLLAVLGRLHGRTSHRWNGDDGRRGRQIWHRAAETIMKSERHFMAALNYVLHNAVRHGYVDHWQDWPYSSAVRYLEEIGRDEAERRWREYAILDFGKDWDPAEM